MTEKMQVNTMEEAQALLRKNSSKEKLDELAQMVDEPSLRLLAAIATGLSWEDKNSAFTNFSLTYKK
jgi:hypothetical protein